MTLQTLHNDINHSLSGEFHGKFTFEPIKGKRMIFKMVRWYVVLTWNFYVVGAKIMALVALRVINRVLLLR